MPGGRINDFFTKRKQNKTAFVDRPDLNTIILSIVFPPFLSFPCRPRRIFHSVSLLCHIYWMWTTPENFFVKVVVITPPCSDYLRPSSIFPPCMCYCQKGFTPISLRGNPNSRNSGEKCSVILQFDVNVFPKFL